jgi:hypothetical protein
MMITANIPWEKMNSEEKIEYLRLELMRLATFIHGVNDRHARHFEGLHNRLTKAEEALKRIEDPNHQG